MKELTDKLKKAGFIVLPESTKYSLPDCSFAYEADFFDLENGMYLENEFRTVFYEKSTKSNYAHLRCHPLCMLNSGKNYPAAIRTAVRSGGNGTRFYFLEDTDLIHAPVTWLADEWISYCRLHNTAFGFLVIALHYLWACSEIANGGNSVEILRKCVTSTPKNVSIPKDYWANEELFLNILSDDTEAMNRLLKGKSFLETCDPLGRTPLYLAAEKGKKGPLEVLIKAGADVGNRCDWGGHPSILFWSVDHCIHNSKDPRWKAIVRSLLDKGAKVNEEVSDELKRHGYRDVKRFLKGIKG
jgi:hypothetical protein